MNSLLRSKPFLLVSLAVVAAACDDGSGTPDVADLGAPEPDTIDRGDARRDVTSESDADTIADATIRDASADVLGPHRRKLLPIIGGSGAGHGYQMEVKIGQSDAAQGVHVHLGGNGRADFGDVRFTASDGTTQLSHWLESVSGAAPDQTATFRVRVTANLDQPQEIYLVYGQASASSASNATGTFDLYDGMETALNNAQVPQVTPTYDGSGQAIHPDVLHFPDGWNGYAYWMAMTPYPGSDDQIENPSLLASTDGVTWVAPPGLAAPLAPAPPCDHNNDTELVYNPETDELWVYYLDTRRSRRCASHEAQPYYDHNYMQRIRVAHDGTQWNVSTTEVSLDQDLSQEALLLSPSIVRRSATQYFLWMSNGSDTVYRFESSDGMSWGAPQRVTLSDRVWHLNVSYIASQRQYWMLSDYPSREGSMLWATSPDGLTWTTYPGVVMAPNTDAWDVNLYRAAFLYNSASDLLRVWYSGYKRDPIVWHTGYTERVYSDFLDQITGAVPGDWSVFAQGGSWSRSTAQTKRGARSAQLVQSSTTPGEKMIVYRELPVATGIVVEWDLYDDLDPSALKLVRLNGAVLSAQTGLGVWTGASTTHYALHDSTYAYTATTVPRTQGWHKFGLRVLGSEATFYIDDTPVGRLPAPFTSAGAVSIEGFHGGPTQFFVDDVRMRKAAVSEPQLGPAGEEERGTYPLFETGLD